MAYQLLDRNVDTDSAKFSVRSGIGVCKMLDKKVVSMRRFGKPRALLCTLAAALPSAHREHVLAF